MAESIVKTFPVLAGREGSGFVSCVHFVIGNLEMICCDMFSDRQGWVFAMAKIILPENCGCSVATTPMFILHFNSKLPCFNTISV